MAQGAFYVHKYCQLTILQIVSNRVTIMFHEKIKKGEYFGSTYSDISRPCDNVQKHSNSTPKNSPKYRKIIKEHTVL